MEILEEEKVRIFRTDQQGAFQYIYKGESGTFSIYPPYDEVSSFK
ncbi:hypothetical protein [Metabacillus arenae]|nr:hypothetical protein [Metabacillus arenae]